MKVGLDTALLSVLGPKTAKALEAEFDMLYVADLLDHTPRRYFTRGELTDLSDLAVDEHVTVLAEVKSVTTRPMRGRKGGITEVVITDGPAEMSLVFFHKTPKPYIKLPKPGTQGLFAGKVGSYNGKRQLAHPEMILGDEIDPLEAAMFAGSRIPIYPASGKVSTAIIARSVRIVLDSIDGELDDPLPPDVRERHGLLGLARAYEVVHQPESVEMTRRGFERLRFDEAFVHQVVLAQRRRALRALPAAPRVSSIMGLLAEFDARMPFELTRGQREAGAIIESDIAQPHPMHRLLQGDVGSGKTIVALRAMLAVVDAGGQAALLAPTEILAQQHYRTVLSLLGPLAERGRLGGDAAGTSVALLTGSASTARRRQALLDIASGEAGIVIGTHALLEDKVTFADLALVVVDEQHRFGVEQRAALAAKAPDGTRPHVLVMTATPIPRTIAMTVFGDLDVVTLRELPSGRQQVETFVVPEMEKPAHLARAWQRVREEVESGRQVYVVCPRIGDEPVEGASVLETQDELTHILPGIRIEALHGRMAADDKDRVMLAYALGEIDVLVATTVIEVGVDVPNASMMVVLDAERFGVSQVHQLRGRIGRGEHPGLCILVTKAPAGSPGRERLDAIASTTDGFALSRLDLQQRREGDVLGAAQSGRRSSLRHLEVVRDEEVVVAARDDATALVESDGVDALPALRWLIDRLSFDESTDYIEKA